MIPDIHQNLTFSGCNFNVNLLLMTHEMMPWLTRALQTPFLTSLSLVGCDNKGSVPCGLSDTVDLLWENKKKFTGRTIVPDTTDGNLNVV